MVEVITFQDWRKLKLAKEEVVITVSKSTTWSKGLSPFVLGPCKLWGNNVSKNVENAWQFSKVYAEHLENGKVGNKWLKWAQDGWADNYAHRYPVGKGAIPEFSYWDGERLDYVSARKRIYIPLYYKAVKDTEAFSRLQELHEQFKNKGKTLYLIDFDAYRHKVLDISYKDVINDDSKTMGHAFVLAMMLEIPKKLEKAIRGNDEEKN